MPGRAKPELRAFDEVWAPLTPTEREDAKRLFLRYLELVVIIADEVDAGDRDDSTLTALREDRTLAMSDQSDIPDDVISSKTDGYYDHTH